MRVAYVHTESKNSDQTEGHILHSLRKLGCEVQEFGQDSNPPTIKAFDVLLFHHWYNCPREWLKTVKITKVCWYFDRILDWGLRPQWMSEMCKIVDIAFVTDGTWAMQSGLPNVRILRQGIGDEDMSRGTPRSEKWGVQVAFLGGTYGERASWARALKARYGEKFGVYNDVHNRDLYDFAETVPIIVAPLYPSDDNYSSNRIFLTCGTGGFLIHPNLKWMRREFKEGVHYAGYNSNGEMYRKIDYFLEHPVERETIRLTGMKHMQENYTFSHRCQKLLKEIQAIRATGSTA